MPTKTAYWPTNRQPEGNFTRVMSPLKFRRTNDSVDSGLSMNATVELLLPHLLAAESRDANTFIGDKHPSHFGPYGIVVDDPPPAIPVKYIMLPKLKSNNWKQWNEARKGNSLAIVVSDYQTADLKLAYDYGLTGGKWIRSDSIQRSLLDCGLFEKGSMPGRVNIGGYTNCYGAELYTPYDKKAFQIGRSPFEDGWSDAAIEEWAKSASFPVDAELVTECLADANTGTVDLLTAVAEAPETFISIFNGCRTILRMFKEARKGDVRLMNRVKRRRLELARLQARSRSDFANIREFERHMQDIRSIEQAIKDLLTAVADIWLQYRLNIYPNVKTIEDALEASGMLDKQFIRFRETGHGTIEVPTVPGFTASRDSFNVVTRCFIKRGAASADMKDLLFTANPFLTAWELVPLSFVLDRYCSIGSLLAAFFGSPSSPKVTEGATFSWTIKDAVTYTHTVSKSTVTVELALYKRLVIDPNSFVCIPFPASRSRNQNLDHLALSWNILLKNLWKV